jgi:DNA invertase Pin-like site-specific DNA recombinase
MKTYVAYYRVSTDRQGRSALGLEAQRESVLRHIASSCGDLVAEYTEVESGKRTDRAQMQAALRECRRRRATLVISRLDRLARNATFLLQLRDSNVEFVAADMPFADRFTVGILALVAERERDLISIRTREALAAAKRRGVKLGGPQPRRAGACGVAAVKAMVNAFDANVLPVVQEIRRAGIVSLRGIAGALNARGLRTRRSGDWSGEAVRLLTKRAAEGTHSLPLR